jgi:glycosyltransferase involved in cell wall biosynthesis
MPENSRKRVLMLVQNNPYPQDTRVRSEAEALLSAGYAVSVISPAAVNQRWRDSANSVNIYRFPPPFEARGFWGYTWEYLYCTAAIFLLSLWVALRGGFDVIHAANPSDTLVFVGAFYKVFGKRFIYDHHDLSPELYDANCGGKGNPLVRRTLLTLEWLSCRLADGVIATNESYKQLEVQRGGVPEHRITIVRNGPDLSQVHFVEPDPELRTSGRVIIGYVGAMGLHDGLDCLMRALGHLVRDLGRTDFMCIIIGKGETLEQLIALKTTLGLDDYVRFTGWVSEANKLRYLCSTDICVDPDPCNPFNDRSTMIKVAEYMALGKPVVGFDLKENRFTAGDAGLFVRSNDEMEFARALAHLMDNAPLRKKMGDFGCRRVASDLAWSHSAARLLSAYKAVLDEPAGNRRQIPIQLQKRGGL